MLGQVFFFWLFCSTCPKVRENDSLMGWSNDMRIGSTSSQSNERPPAPPGPKNFVEWYLLSYNQVSFLGWFWILYLTVSELYQKQGDYRGVFDLVWPSLSYVQTAALFEVNNTVDWSNTHNKIGSPQYLGLCKSTHYDYLDASCFSFIPRLGSQLFCSRNSYTLVFLNYGHRLVHCWMYAIRVLHLPPLRRRCTRFDLLGSIQLLPYPLSSWRIFWNDDGLSSLTLCQGNSPSLLLWSHCCCSYLYSRYIKKIIYAMIRGIY